MAGPFWPARPRADSIEDLRKTRERVRALEVGAHPVRSLASLAQTTPWISIDRAAGWTGTVAWRIASNVVQLRGTLTGPAGWASGVLAAVLPADALPSWQLTLVGISGTGKLIRVLVSPSGELRPYRDDAASVQVVIDPLRFARG